MRRVLTQALRDAGFDVVGEAADGDEALALYRELRPDAMTLDLAMPGMDGIGVLRALRGERSSLPVVVVSAFSPAHGARAVDALAEGAFDLVAKPVYRRAAGAVRRRAAREGHRGRRVGLHRAVVPTPQRVPLSAAPAVSRLRARRAPAAAKKVVLIATSTGGPRALARLIPALPSPLGAGGMIIQHMPEGFTASLAERLDRSSKLKVRRGHRRRDAGARHPAARRGRPPPAPRRGWRGAALRRGGHRRPAPARRPHDRRRRQALRRPPAAGRHDRHGQGRPRRRPRGAGPRRPDPGRGRVQLHRLRHAARDRRSAAGRRRRPARRARRGASPTEIGAHEHRHLQRRAAPRRRRRVRDVLQRAAPRLRHRPVAVQARPDGAAHPLVRRDARRRRPRRLRRHACGPTRRSWRSSSTA